MDGISSAFFLIEPITSSRKSFSFCISLSADSVKAALPRSIDERNTLSAARRLSMWAATTSMLLSFADCSTPAASLPDTPIVFNEDDIFSTH